VWGPSSGDAGGAILVRDASPTIERCVFTDNQAENGSVLGSVGHGSPTLLGCRMYGNISRLSDWYGGTIYCSVYGSLTLKNCVVTRNIGSGIYVATAGQVLLVGCAITQNTCYAMEGPLVSLVVSDSILWGNRLGLINQLALSAPRAIISYSVVQGGWEGMGEHNLDVDPRLTADGHLLPDSPCIDAGNPNRAADDSERDFDLEPRIFAGRVDIGPDEFIDQDADGLPSWWEEEYFGSPTVATAEADPDGDGVSNSQEYSRSLNPGRPPLTFYVDAAAGNDQWDGLASVWDGVHGPKATVQAAIDAAGPYDGDHVVLAPGTYTGPGNRDLDFRGKVVTVRSADPDDPAVVAATVIDCQASEDDPHRGLRFHSLEGPDSAVAGLTIVNGYAPREGGVSSEHRFGGGIYGKASSPTILKCVVRGNRAFRGAGIYLSLEANARIVACTIEDNRADIGSGTAGGVYSKQSSPLISQCLIRRNMTGYGTGGISCVGGSPRIERCRIVGNFSTNPYVGTGGISFSGGSPRVSNCLIRGNWTVHGGGAAIETWSSHLLIRNCLIDSNFASQYGAGIYARDANVTVRNSILFGNVPRQLGGEEIAVTYCLVEGGWEGGGNLDADPLLTADGHLQSGSPCLDAGDPAYEPAEGETDIDGEPRVADGRIDIGIDEFIDSDGDGLPDWWEQAYFGSPEAADPAADPDADAHNNLEEYIASTHPLRPPKTYYVDAASGNDSWDGLAPAWDGEHGPKATIQAGIDAIDPKAGGVVIVAPGLYTGQGNRDLDFRGKAITVRSVDPEDPAVVAATVIDCQGPASAAVRRSRSAG